MSRIKKSIFYNTNDTGFCSYLKIGMFLEVQQLPNITLTPVEQN